MAWVLKMDEVIESGLVHDFDASLSGIGQELGAGAYSMRGLCQTHRKLRAFIESKNSFGWKNPFKIIESKRRSSPSKSATTPDHVPKYDICLSFEHLQVAASMSPGKWNMMWLAFNLQYVAHAVTEKLENPAALLIPNTYGEQVYTVTFCDTKTDVLALPIFKQEDSSLPQENETKHPPFQYVMCAATSPAVKLYDETLTYLNQGQSYEIRMLDNRKAGDIPEINGKLVKSIIRVVFHDRRLQYTEHQQLEGWKWNRPGDRLLDLDIPMSVGVIDIKTNPSQLNAVEFLWDPTKCTSAFIQVHCISTEFTPRKHGGEKGVPFRIQVDTFKQTENGEYTDHLHSASCQIKVFKPKGADRKQKTDREKMEKRTAHEKEKYQPSYDTTVLTEMRLEPIIEDAVEHEQKKSSKRTLPADYGDSLAKRGSCSPWPDTPTTFVNNSPTPAPTFTSAQHNTYSVPDSNSSSPNHQGDGTSQGSGDQLHPSATIQETQQWLLKHRFSTYTRLFSNFSGADLLKLTREDLVQICGPADGIRLYNALKSRSVRPRLTIYVCQEPLQSIQLERQDAGNGDSSNGAIYVYHAIYLEEMAASEVTRKLALAFNIPLHQINQVYRQGPTGIHILVSDQMVQNFQDESCFLFTTIKAENGEGFHIILK